MHKHFLHQKKMSNEEISQSTPKYIVYMYVCVHLHLRHARHGPNRKGKRRLHPAIGILLIYMYRDLFVRLDVNRETS